MRAAVIGASGLIGGYLVSHLLENPVFSEVVLLVRKELPVKAEKLKQIIVDFDNERAFEDALQGAEIVFCSTGTTLARVKGDMEAYKKVDYHLPVNAARFAKAQGCRHFLLVSSVGANANSRGFYLKFKGQVEDEIKKMQLPHASIFRPSMLLGDRKEFRLGERIAKAIMVVFSFLIPSAYKPIEADAVAKAMIVQSLKTDADQFSVMDYTKMLALTKSYG